MSVQTLAINFSSEASTIEPEVLIMLEQTGFSNYTGQVTKMQAVRFIADLLYNTGENTQINCGFDGESVNILISAYPFVEDLVYYLLCSYGTLSERSVEEIEKTETIQLKLSEENVKYPVHSIKSVKWLNKAFDADLNEILPLPEIIIGDDYNKISSSIPCYGSVIVNYTTIVHSYILNVPKRETTDQNKYTSVVFAVYDYGLVYLQTQSPPSAEETDGNCGAGYESDIQLPGNNKFHRPVADHIDKTTYVDYCSQTVTSVVLEETPDSPAD